MKRQMGYGLLCGVLGALLLVLCASVSLATEPCSIWYDQRQCGDGPIEYDGDVLYQFEMLESPISVASGGGWYPGQLYADFEKLAYTDNHGNITAAEYNIDTGCYEHWNGEMGSIIKAFCVNGDVVNYWYGTIYWTGFGSELGGPWLYHVTIARPEVAASPEQNRVRVAPRAPAPRAGGRRVGPAQP